jgi:hypothetical protein
MEFTCSLDPSSWKDYFKNLKNGWKEEWVQFLEIAKTMRSYSEESSTTTTSEASTSKPSAISEDLPDITRTRLQAIGFNKMIEMFGEEIATRGQQAKKVDEWTRGRADARELGESMIRWTLNG